MNLLTKVKRGFTLIELMIVVTIIGILANFSVKAFYQIKDKMQYEKFIYTLQYYAQEARNKSIVNEAKYDAASPDKFSSDAKGHGVYFEKISDTEFKTILFKDNDDGKDYDVGEELKEYSEEKVIRLKSFTGIEDQKKITVTNLEKATIYFNPDPDPFAIVNAVDTASTPYTLREIEIKFYYPRDNNEEGFRKKFMFNVISKISEVNEYPIIVDAIKTSDTKIVLTVNEDIGGADPKNDFMVFDKNKASYAVSSASVSGKTITLTTASLGVNFPYEVIYNNKGNITTADSIDLMSRRLTIEQ